VSVWKYPRMFAVFLFVSILDHASQLTCALILPFEYSLNRLSMSVCQEFPDDHILPISFM